MSDTKPITLGEKYRDTITGFEGTVTARSEFLSGCVRYLIEGQMNPDSTASSEFWFDEQRLVAIESNDKPKATATAGGPHPDAPRTSQR
jgi:hypothetical protein